MKKVAGVFVLLLGILLGSWIFYNLFVQRLPEAQGRSPIVPILVTIAFIYVGVKWIRGEVAG